MDPRPLVALLGTDARLDAMRGLVGGVNARELRDVVVPDDVFEALVGGLGDPNAKIRWLCLQLLDHLDDERAIAAIATCLVDPVPRVRLHAAHALGCIGCKPSWDGQLPDGVGEQLAALAERDPSPKVRRTAAHALACRVG